MGACGAIIVLCLLVASSLIDAGHGILGISLEFSVGILVAAVCVLVGILFRYVRGAVAVGSPPELGGLIRARRKCELEAEEWLALLIDAREEFYIAGHSLGSWCSESNRGPFTEGLRKLLQRGGRATLVMLARESPQREALQVATQIDYSEKIELSRRVLFELHETLDENSRRRLRIIPIDDDAPLPYMVVGNERRLVTTTYLARTDSESMPCLELERRSESGRAIYDDFHKLAEEGEAAGASDPGQVDGKNESGGIFSRFRRDEAR